MSFNSTDKGRSSVDYSSALGIGALLVCTSLLYANAVNIPFLGPERSGLLFTEVFTDLSVFWERMATLKGIFHKPLSMLTFALQFEFFGRDASQFHLVNIAIHLVNTFLVWRLAHCYRVAPLCSAAVFAVHPLQTGAAALLYGRPYSLGTCFLLIALLLWEKRVKETSAAHWNTGLWLVVLWVLMVLSKQVFIVFPALFIWLLICRNELKLLDLCRKGFKSYFYPAVGGLTLVGLVLILYAVPYSKTAVVSPQVFFQSQLGNAWTIMTSMFLIPWRTGQLHDLPWYFSFQQLDVALGAAAAAAMGWAAWRYRLNRFGFVLGAFLILVLPTNSVFPKDQVVVDWRFYPAMVFFSLLIAVVIEYLFARFSKLIVGPLAAALIAIYGCFTYAQIQDYQSIEQAYLDVLAIYPQSLYALNDLGNHYRKQGDLAQARYYLNRAYQVAPRSRIVNGNLKLLQDQEKLQRAK